MTTENNTPDLEAIEKDLTNYKIRISRSMFHLGTPQKHFVLRGVGITRKVKGETKKARKLAKKMRSLNRK